MTSVKVRLRVTVLQSSLVTEFSPKESLSIRSSSSVHTVDNDLEIGPVEQCSDSLKVEKFLHKANILSDVLDYFDDKNRFRRPSDVDEMVVTCFGDIDSLEEGVVSDRDGRDDCTFLVYQVCKLLLSRTTVPRVKFDSKIFMRSSWVVTGCQQDASKTVSIHFVEFSDIS